VLGSGGNTVFSDFGFAGLVIHNRSRTIAFLLDHSQVIVDSGVPSARLIMEAAAKNLGGLEFLATIPGTIGGAVYGNAGAYGGITGDFVRGATLLLPDGTVKNVAQAWLQFQYRSSKLKRLPRGHRQPIILSVRLQFQHFKREDILKKISEMHKKRRERQPQGLTVSGSIFRNPAGRPSHLEGESKAFIERTASYLIRSSGAHRLRVGGAAIAKENANWITNLGNARASDIRELAERVRLQVREKTGEVLEEEIEYLGQW
ncbi:UDP-N-acetylmuramate dehydrogenase, partial [Candidatus Berkelbacteria bacterium]|nr:UDP-N-acetylmuramate dehydrogenase [Candidatus Berkelbacteria bacterium]